jgi:hypothetical protein
VLFVRAKARTYLRGKGNCKGRSRSLRDDSQKGKSKDKDKSESKDKDKSESKDKDKSESKDKDNYRGPSLRSG